MARQVNYILRDLLRTAREARLGPSAQKIIDEATVYLAHFRRGNPVPNPDQPAEGDLIGDESGEIQVEFDTSDDQPVVPGGEWPTETGDLNQPIVEHDIDGTDTGAPLVEETVASTPASIVNETSAQRRRRLRLEREGQ